MLFPMIYPRIEKTNYSIGERIPQNGPRLLVIIAPETAEAQIVQVARAALRCGQNVVDREIVTGLARRRTTVLAEFSRPGANKLPHGK